MKELGIIALFASAALGSGFGLTARGCHCIYGFNLSGSLVLLHNDVTNSRGCGMLHLPDDDVVEQARPGGEIRMTIISNRFIPVSRCQYRLLYTDKSVEPWTIGAVRYFGTWALVAASPLLLWLIGCLVAGLRQKSREVTLR